MKKIIIFLIFFISASIILPATEYRISTNPTELGTISRSTRGTLISAMKQEEPIKVTLSKGVYIVSIGSQGNRESLTQFLSALISANPGKHQKLALQGIQYRKSHPEYFSDASTNSLRELDKVLKQVGMGLNDPSQIDPDFFIFADTNDVAQKAYDYSHVIKQIGKEVYICAKSGQWSWSTLKEKLSSSNRWSMDGKIFYFSTGFHLPVKSKNGKAPLLSSDSIPNESEKTLRRQEQERQEREAKELAHRQEQERRQREAEEKQLQERKAEEKKRQQELQRQREAEERAQKQEQERRQQEAEQAQRANTNSYVYTAPDGKVREITLGITYLAGNPDRDRLSEKVAENHAEYAARWGLQQEIETANLLVDQCVDINKHTIGWLGVPEHPPVDCVPYWNKVMVLKRWLETPQPQGVEAWYFMMDDDMPVTNMTIDPYEAIDLLRDNDDQSIIIAEDIIPWNGSSPSPNTGLMMVRHDAVSREFIAKLWETRFTQVENGPEYCRTLGVCHKQYRLHEQQGFADIMENDPRLARRVALVPARSHDPSSPRYHIALNTFHREGCFYRDMGGWDSGGFTYNDPSWGKWRQGDWMGQTAGVPTWGWWCGDRWTKTSGPIRADMIDQMIDAIVR